MWKIFQAKELTVLEAFQSVSDWKALVFSKMDIRLKQYFAEKVVIHFDNMMLFQQKRGMHENLMEALSIAEKEMQNADILFQEIRCFWIPEEEQSFLITLNLPAEESFYPNGKYGFELIKDDAVPMEGRKDKLQQTSWENLVFSPDLSDFARGWINYTPALEERSKLQAKFILLNANFKKPELSLLEKIQFEEKIETHPQYNELYNKVLRIMPRIESSLEQEWRTAIVQGLNPSINMKKGKNNIK